MKINIKAIHFEIKDEIRDYAAEKIGKLDNYYKNIIKADIFIENHESEPKNGNNYTTRVRLSVPGKNLFAEAVGVDEFSSIDNVEDKLKKQIEKLKGKQNKGKLDKFQGMVRNFFGKD